MLDRCFVFVCCTLLVTSVARAQEPGECVDVVALGTLFEVPSRTAIGSPPDEDMVPASEAALAEGGSSIFSFPARVQLSREPAGDRFQVVIPEGSQQTRHRFRVWYEESDSVIVLLSTGFAGVEARLARRGDTLAGVLTTFTDIIGRPVSRRAITLRVVPCASPAPIPASEDPPLPRGVDLGDVRVELGGELPGGIMTEPRPSGAFTIVAEPTGLFADAEEVVVRLDSDGLVSLIQMTFAVGADADDITDRITAAFQAPDAPPEVDFAMPRFWSNRTTSLGLLSGNGAAHGPRLTLFDPRSDG